MESDRPQDCHKLYLCTATAEHMVRPWRSFRALQMSEFSDFTWEYSPWDITLKVGGSYIIYIFIYDNMMV